MPCAVKHCWEAKSYPSSLDTWDGGPGWVCVSGVTLMQVGGDWHNHWGFRTCHQSWHQLGVSFECPLLGGAAKGVLGFPFLSYCPPSMGICGSIFPFPWEVWPDKFSYLVHPRPSCFTISCIVLVEISTL